MKTSFLRKPIVHVIVIAVLGLLIYSNALHVPFHFDDGPNIAENHLIRDASNIPSILAGTKGPYASRPLMHLTFALNYYFGGLDTTGYHVVNIALHILNGILLYLLVVMTGRHMEYDEERVRAVALCSAVLFIAHPLQTEAVTYIISRSMLLATTFCLTSVILFLRAVTTDKHKSRYIAALFLASMCGMGSRESFAMLPFLLLAYDLFFVSNFDLRKVKGHIVAYVPVLLSLGYLAHLVMNNSYDTLREFPTQNIPHSNYALTEFGVHWTYLRLLALPLNQNLDYDYPISTTLLDLRTALSLVGYAAVWISALIYARKKPIAAFAVIWFFIALFPISFGVTLLKGLKLNDVISEHRLYLPGIALFPAIAAGLFYLRDPLSAFKPARFVIPAAMILLVLSYGSASYARNTVWQSGISMWEDVVAKSPMKARGHCNLGLYYTDVKFFSKALEQYEIALRLVPDDYMYINNIGAAYKKMDLVDDALELYRRALKINPKFAPAYNNIGDALETKGSSEDAIMYYLDAIKFDPKLEIAHYNLGSAYINEGRVDEGIAELRTALILDPNDAYAHNLLGIALGSRGLFGEAVEHFEKAVALDPDLKDAKTNLDAARKLKNLKDSNRELFNKTWQSTH